VDKLLRQFTADVLDRFDKVGSGLITPNDSAEADKGECLRLAGIFSGDEDGYAELPGWTGYGLAEYIRDRMGEIVQNGDDRDVIAQAFAVFLQHIYAQLRRMGSVPDEQVQDALTENIRSFTWLLIGLESNE